ncbi:MAG: ExbD/TolR family protein [Phycisphaerae bacterium]
MLIRPKETGTGLAIEMTPMIDMVFLLLIFFLVATRFQQEEREMQIALPEARTAGPISAVLREIIINVGPNGEIIVNARRVEPDRLRAIIEQAVKNNPDQKVTVRGDRNTTYANVIRVLDICKGAGIQEPYLDTILGP